MEILRTVDQGGDRIEPNTTLENSSVTIEFGDSTDPEVLISDYPFPDQQIIAGKVKYEGEVLIEGISPNIEEYEIEYRTGSKILRLSGIGDSSEATPVISAIGNAIQGSPLRRISFSRLGLWSFIFAGTQQARIEVIDVQKNDYLEFKEMEDLSRPELSRESDLSAATVYYSKGSKIPFTYVKYSDENLKFNDESTQRGREYVLQLFERHVIDNQHLSELEEDNNLVGGPA